ncbi:MAG: PAS domain-containing protein [Desulfomonilaceae bacterium]
MSDDQTWSEFQKSWKDTVGKEDPEKRDSLIRSWVASDDPREMTHELYGPNIANSTMFVVLAESSSDPHFIKDGSFKYIYVNEAMEQMLGRSKKEIMGLTDEQLFSHEELGSMISATCRSLQGRIVQERNVRSVAGTRRTFLDTLVPWRNDLGQIVAICGTSVDVTERKGPLPSVEIDESECRLEAMRAMHGFSDGPTSYTAATWARDALDDYERVPHKKQYFVPRNPLELPGDCQVGKGWGQTPHLHMVFLARSILMHQLRQGRECEWAWEGLTTIGRACMSVLRQILSDTVSWVIDRIENDGWNFQRAKVKLHYPDSARVPLYYRGRNA